MLSLFIAFFTLTFSHATDQIQVIQKWCANGTFQLIIDDARAKQPFQRDQCMIVARDGMSSPKPVVLNVRFNAPMGNFVDYLLSNTFGRSDITHRNFPLAEKRDYILRPMTCETRMFFAVEAEHFASNKQEEHNPVQAQCTYDPEVKFSSDLPVAGVYQRTANQSPEGFAERLTR